jgi:type IV pilus biogenesis protein PilP
MSASKPLLALLLAGTAIVAGNAAADDATASRLGKLLSGTTQEAPAAQTQTVAPTPGGLEAALKAAGAQTPTQDAQKPTEPAKTATQAPPPALPPAFEAPKIDLPQAGVPPTPIAPPPVAQTPIPAPIAQSPTPIAPPPVMKAPESAPPALRAIAPVEAPKGPAEPPRASGASDPTMRELMRLDAEILLLQKKKERANLQRDIYKAKMEGGADETPVVAIPSPTTPSKTVADEERTQPKEQIVQKPSIGAHEVPQLARVEGAGKALTGRFVTANGMRIVAGVGHVLPGNLKVVSIEQDKAILVRDGEKATVWVGPANAPVLTPVMNGPSGMGGNGGFSGGGNFGNGGNSFGNDSRGGNQAPFSGAAASAPPPPSPAGGNMARQIQ